MLPQPPHVDPEELVAPGPHVLVDATAIPEDRGGVGRYLVQLIPALSRLDVRLTIACTPRDSAYLRDLAPGAHIEPIAVAGRFRGARILWEQSGLPRLARRLRADVIFSPHYTMPRRAPVPVVVTLHDATFFSHPELHGRVKRIFFRWWTRRALDHAAACLVPSHATESELLRWVRPRQNRMTVAYHGVDAAMFHRPSRAEIDSAAALVVGGRWIAFLGTLEPRKNVSNLIRAFSMLEDEPELRLAIAGGRGWDADVDVAIAQSPAARRIQRLGFVADSELPGLLGGSEVFAYPSRGEGFGLPVLEAMACGAVVVTTRYLALPEVGGDVAIYSELDAESIAAAIRSALAGPSGSRRTDGVKRAAQFSWESSARTHLAVFAAAAEKVA